MNWLVTAILCIVLVEVASRLPFGKTIAELRHVSERAIRTVRARSVSDHWKERAMAAYAKACLAASLKLGGFIFLLSAIAIGMTAFLSMFFEDLISFAVSRPGITFGILFAIFYLVIRRMAGHGRQL